MVERLGLFESIGGIGLRPERDGEFVRHSDYAALERQIAELRASTTPATADGWRPMEDGAPKDGDPVDLWCLWPEHGREYRTPNCRWIDGEWKFIEFSQSQYAFPPVPKFWMRPAAPTATGGR